MSRRVIYLDVDGVLNNGSTQELSPDGWTGISPGKVKILRRILDATGAELVLTSTWRNEWSPDYEECTADGKYLTDRLMAEDIRISDKIQSDLTALRGLEITMHAEQNGITSWIVLDDEPFDFFMQGICDTPSEQRPARWIRTTIGYHGGLQEKHIARAVKLFAAQERFLENQNRNQEPKTEPKAKSEPGSGFVNEAQISDLELDL